MNINVLASGSNGNSCLIEDKKTSILIDAGKSCKELESRMNKLGKSMENVDAILITHSHVDHISGAGVVSRKYDIPIYMTNNVYLESRFELGDFQHRLFDLNKEFKIKKLLIKPINTSHDVSSCGFKIGNFAILTDTGKVTEQMKTVLPKLKAVLLEFNYDMDMLIKGPYPYFLKQRILSNQGHLSNIHASQLIQSKGKNLALVLLGHLSCNSTTPEITKVTYETLVKRKLQSVVCSREKQTGTYEV